MLLNLQGTKHEMKCGRDQSQTQLRFVVINIPVSGDIHALCERTHEDRDSEKLLIHQHHAFSLSKDLTPKVSEQILWSTVGRPKSENAVVIHVQSTKIVWALGCPQNMRLQRNRHVHIMMYFMSIKPPNFANSPVFVM